METSNNFTYANIIATLKTLDGLECTFGDKKIFSKEKFEKIKSLLLENFIISFDEGSKFVFVPVRKGTEKNSFIICDQENVDCIGYKPVRIEDFNEFFGNSIFGSC